MLRASDAPSCVRCHRRGDSPASATCPLTRPQGGGGQSLHGAVMAMQSDGKHPLAPGSCRGHLVSPSVPQPTSPRAAPHPSPWQRAFFTFFSICCPSGLRCWQPRTLQAGSRRIHHPPSTLRGAGRAGTGPAARQNSHRRLWTHSWWVLEHRMDFGQHRSSNEHLTAGRRLICPPGATAT